ncbi:MAG: hypothetical protein MJE66_13420 [Proteobacteria bacterium]|nr:hypothetical protein [Pseudomonadota bacterium]
MRTVLLLGAWGMYAFLCVFVWVEADWRLEWDSALYLLTGRSLASGAGYQYLGEPFTLRPPGFPSWIAWWGGGGEFEFERLNRMVMVFAALAAGAVYWAVAGVRDHGRGVWVTALAVTCPLWAGRFNWIQSEFPFLLFLFSAFALQRRAATGGPRAVVFALGAGLALAAAFYMRSVALLALPGMLWVGGGRAGSPTARFAAPLLALALAAPWLWWSAGESGAVPDQQLLASYATALLHVDPGDPASDRVGWMAFAARLFGNGGRIAAALADNVLAVPSAALGLLLFFGLAVGVWRGMRAGSAVLEWWFVAYLGLLLVYFSFASRLLVPLIPGVYLALWKAVEASPARAQARPWLRHAPAVAAALLLLVNLVRLPGSLAPHEDGVGPSELRTSWERTRVAAAWLRERTADDAVLLCNQAPIYAVLSGRRSYTYRFPRGRDPIDRYGPDHVLLDGRGAVARELGRALDARGVPRQTIPGASVVVYGPLHRAGEEVQSEPADGAAP